jgi:hypothetical protein
MYLASILDILGLNLKQGRSFSVYLQIGHDWLPQNSPLVTFFVISPSHFIQCNICSWNNFI